MKSTQQWWASSRTTITCSTVSGGLQQQQQCDVNVEKMNEMFVKECLHSLCLMRRAQLAPPVCTTFYRGTIESRLTGCITIMLGGCRDSDRKSMQRVVKRAEKLIRVSPPSISDFSHKHPQHYQRLHPPSSWTVLPAALCEEILQHQGQGSQILQQLHPQS